MTIENIRIFFEVVQDMNLSVTAERLHTSQQALSGQIKRLEKHFGVKLFYRRPGLELTKEGMLVKNEAIQIIDSENRLFAAFGKRNNEETGALKLACSLSKSNYYLPEVLARFAQDYPNVIVQCIDENSLIDAQVFKERDIDLLIGYPHGKNEGIKAKTLFESRMMVIISRELLEMHIGKQTDEQIDEWKKNGINLSELPYSIPLMYTSTMSTTHWLNSFIPEAKNYAKYPVNYGSGQVSMALVKKNQTMIIISELFCWYLNSVTPIERQNDLLFLPLIYQDKQFTLPETYAYDPSVVHSQFFFDFIKIVRDVLKEKGLS
ncbi:MAG: LysR family transcriptional regulator [Clostridia bacterium]|nr:LysR family transcriptional regulator [Clostridia bacterium]